MTPGVSIRGALVQMGKLKIDRTRWDQTGAEVYACDDSKEAFWKRLRGCVEQGDEP